MALPRAGCHVNEAPDMNKPLRPALLLLAALLAAGVAPAGSAADPRQDLHKAFVHNLALKSYKATMTDLKSNRIASTAGVER